MVYHGLSSYQFVNVAINGGVYIRYTLFLDTHWHIVRQPVQGTFGPGWSTGSLVLADDADFYRRSMPGDQHSERINDLLKQISDFIDWIAQGPSQWWFDLISQIVKAYAQIVMVIYATPDRPRFVWK